MPSLDTVGIARRARRAIIVCALAAAAAACAAQRYDLRTVHASDTVTRSAPPLVFVHGAFGSRLRSRQGCAELWPGGVLRLLLDDYRDLALPIDATARAPAPALPPPSGLCDVVGGRSFYRSMLDSLEQAGGYAHTEPGVPRTAGERAYYIFTYDWRLDFAHNARSLGEFLAAIRADFGDPALAVDVITHSAGALLARYYVRYGTTDVLDDAAPVPSLAGARDVRNLIMIGPPNLGALSDIELFVRGYRVGLRRIPPEVLMTMPAAYQVLPHPGRSWLADAAGQRLERDLYDADTWRALGWAVYDPGIRARIASASADGSGSESDAGIEALERFFAAQLRRARAFHRSLSVPVRAPMPRYFVIGADCLPTQAAVVSESGGRRPSARFSPAEIESPLPSVDYRRLLHGPGDGSVGRDSALAGYRLGGTAAGAPAAPFPLTYAMMLCEQHDQLTENVNVQAAVLRIVLGEQ